jgi:hypothetical protein
MIKKKKKNEYLSNHLMIGGTNNFLKKLPLNNLSMNLIL